MAKPIPGKKSLKSIVVLLLISGLLAQRADAQKILPADRKKLDQKEDTLKRLAADIILDSLTAGRMRSDSQFIRTLVRALQIKNSFYFPFASVQGISKLYAPDSTFRIFTWNITYDDYYSRQRGAIQLRTSDGSLKLIALRDFSEFTPDAMDSVRTKDNWIGAVYYDIVKTSYNGKNFYTLLGYDDNSVMSNKKWIEVLSFNENNQPIFGGRYFSFEDDSVKREPQYRFSMEYKKEARAILKYDEDDKLIVVDHLISETDEPDNKWTYVPDGDYEAFKWQNGKWLHIDKLYHFKLQEGQEPVGDPLLDPKGNVNEKKLEEKSDKNRSRSKGD